MKENKPLLFIKLVHTLIWVCMVLVIFYVLYSGFFNNITQLTWVAIALVILETIILLSNGWQCPLTIVARKYSNSTKDNFDIFLPNWLARHNKTIFGSLFTIGLILVLWHTF